MKFNTLQDFAKHAKGVERLEVHLKAELTKCRKMKSFLIPVMDITFWATRGIYTVEQYNRYMGIERATA